MTAIKTQTARAVSTPPIDVTETFPRRRAWLILALVAIPVFIGSLDLTIVSAFLPEIIVNLRLPVESVIDDAAWVVTGYLLAYTVSMTFMGRLSDLIGRRRALIACLIVFMIGSFIVAEVDPESRTGISGALFNLLFRLGGERPEPGSVALITIIIGRIVQALGAGALVPVALALVGDLFPREKRGQPLGLIGAIDTLGWVLGHLYGGIMVRFFSVSSGDFVNFFRSIGLNWGAPDWRALFWINIPISIIALIFTVFALRNIPQQRSTGRFDGLGALLITGALTCLVVGLGANIEVASSTASFEELGGFPNYAIPVLIAGAAMFVGFLFVELRTTDPLIDLRAFRRRSVSMGSLANLFVGFCLMIGLVSVPILVNVRQPDSSYLAEAALQVGILLSALTVPMALAAIPGGWLNERIGSGRAAALGFGIAAVGFALMWRTWTLDVSDSLIVVEMILVGIGLGLTFSPISAAIINTADEDRLGSASALVIIMRLLGMTIGISLLTALASQRLGYLAGFELGGSDGIAIADPNAAVLIYLRLTVQVLAEMGLIGAVICGLGIIPAALLQNRAQTITSSPAPSP